MGRLHGFERKRPPFDVKNPLLSRILLNKELHLSASERSCRHIEFESHDGKYCFNNRSLFSLFVCIL